MNGEMPILFIEVPTDLFLALMEKVRLSAIYTLMGSEFESHLPEDFKPHKWRGYELEFAEECLALHRRMLDVGKKQIG